MKERSKVILISLIITGICIFISIPTFPKKDDIDHLLTRLNEYKLEDDYYKE